MQNDLLGYIKGDKRSLAVDAGHSEAHIREFYGLLQKEGLPLPSLTVLTHWHWDHTFAVHAVNGLTIANKTTNGHLLECRIEQTLLGMKNMEGIETQTSRLILKPLEPDTKPD